MARDRSYSYTSLMSERTYKGDVDDVSFEENNTLINENNELKTNTENKNILKVDNNEKIPNDSVGVEYENQKKLIEEVEKARLDKKKIKIRDLIKERKDTIAKTEKILSILNTCIIHRKTIENQIKTIVKDVPEISISDLNINDEPIKIDIEKINGKSNGPYDNTQEELTNTKNAIKIAIEEKDKAVLENEKLKRNIYEKEDEIEYLKDQNIKQLLQLKISEEKQEQVHSEIEKINKEKKLLLSSIEEKNNEISSLKRKNESQQIIIEKTKQELEKSREEIEEILKEKKSAIREKERIMDEISAKECEIELLKEKNKKQALFIKESEEELEYTQEEVKKTKIEKIMNMKDIEEKKSEINILKEKNKKQQLLLEKSKTDLEKVFTEVENTFLFINKKNEEIEILKNEKERSIEIVNNKVKEIESIVNNIKNIKIIEKEEANKTVKKMEEEIASLKRENERKQSIIDDTKKEFENTMNELKTAQNDKININRKIEEKDNEIVLLSNSKKAQQILITKLQHNLEKVQEELTESEKNNDELKDENQKIMNKVTEMQNIISTLNKEKGSKQKELEELKAKHSSCNSKEFLKVEQKKADKLNEQLSFIKNNINEAKFELKKYMKDLEVIYPELKINPKQSNMYNNIYNLFVYSIDSLSYIKESNDCSKLNKHFNKCINIMETVLNKVDHPCSLIRFDLCDYEGKNGKIYGNINETKSVVNSSCGCKYHTTCLKSALAVRNYNDLNQINKPIKFKCPNCHEDTTATLLS
ncbi:hypothetical protein BCR36DRAFT_583586 [Piromyces finnis]|uniref:RING-type domain-containing protein n=1 Tax=Piromyces finnis TaxID=1754191 RepID=A0A1Y1V9R5_9FUNG|nr:hypothetical protein BCR36DRAFT_583586 [Piromyces finnis]|eukprot:ORX49972.1 hypothetical protein BCR36DRAFT_583586 [Piromyces finnis]